MLTASSLPKDRKGKPLESGVYRLWVTRKKAVKMKVFEDDFGDLFCQPVDGSGGPQRIDEMVTDADWESID